MGIFDRWRRAPQPPPNGGHEGSVLPALTPQAADRLMAMARTDLAERGLEATIHAGHLELADGRIFGLHNLSVWGSRVREREWPVMIARHMDMMLDKPDSSGLPDPGKILAKLRLREDLPEQPRYDALEPVPGVVAVVALDHPQHVVETMTLPEGVPDVATSMTLARANLVELPLPDHSTKLLDEDDPTSRVHFFGTDDFFGASRLLVIHDLLARVDVAHGRGGLLIAVPYRHVLVVHPISGTGVVPALNFLVRCAEGEYETEPGPVSPHVYHLASDGRTSVVTRAGESGNAVFVEGAFQEAFMEAIADDAD